MHWESIHSLFITMFRNIANDLLRGQTYLNEGLNKTQFLLTKKNKFYFAFYAKNSYI